MTKAPEPKKSESVVDPNESKSDKFKRLAKARVTKTLKTISQIENLAGSNYSYTPEQAGAIITALNEAVRSVETKLAKSATKSEITFDFIDK